MALLAGGLAVTSCLVQIPRQFLTDFHSSWRDLKRSTRSGSSDKEWKRTLGIMGEGLSMVVVCMILRFKRDLPRLMKAYEEATRVRATCPIFCPWPFCVVIVSKSSEK